MNDIDLIIENIREYCDANGIPFPEVMTEDTGNNIVVTMVFKKEK
jgi:hypothetical protein